MTPVTIGVIGILFLFFLLAVRMQVGFAMALVGFLGFAILSSYESSAMIVGMEPLRSDRPTASLLCPSSFSWPSLPTTLKWALKYTKPFTGGSGSCPVG
jgi:hypothetical protein